MFCDPFTSTTTTNKEADPSNFANFSAVSTVNGLFGGKSLHLQFEELTKISWQPSKLASFYKHTKKVSFILPPSKFYLVWFCWFLDDCIAQLILVVLFLLNKLFYNPSFSLGNINISKSRQLLFGRWLLMMVILKFAVCLLFIMPVTSLSICNCMSVCVQSFSSFCKRTVQGFFVQSQLLIYYIHSRCHGLLLWFF